MKCWRPTFGERALTFYENYSDPTIYKLMHVFHEYIYFIWCENKCSTTNKSVHVWGSLCP